MNDYGSGPRSEAAWSENGLMQPSGQDRQQQQRHDVGDLDHWIDRWSQPCPCSGSPIGIAGHRRLVQRRSLCRRDDLPRYISWHCPARPPPDVIEIATNNPVTMVPSSICTQRGRRPRNDPAIRSITTQSTIGANTGNSDGAIISLIAALVSRSTAVPYSGLRGALHDALNFLGTDAAPPRRRSPPRGPRPSCPWRRTGKAAVPPHKQGPTTTNGFCQRESRCARVGKIVRQVTACKPANSTSDARPAEPIA